MCMSVGCMRRFVSGYKCVCVCLGLGFSPVVDFEQPMGMCLKGCPVWHRFID